MLVQIVQQDANHPVRITVYLLLCFSLLLRHDSLTDRVAGRQPVPSTTVWSKTAAVASAPPNSERGNSVTRESSLMVQTDSRGPASRGSRLI